MESLTTCAGTANQSTLAERLAGKQAFWLAIFCLSVFSLLSLLGARLLGDPDTLWHIAAGNWIIAHHEVPTTDPFSFSFRGAKWIPHEWLAEIVLAASHASLGWAGPVLVTALSVSATLTLLLRFLLRYVEPLHAFAGCALTFLTLIQHMLARPHILAWTLLILWVSELAIAREQNRRPSLLLPAVMLLWANLHASFLLGLGIAGVLAMEAILADGDRRQAVRAWIPFLALALLAALATPNGVDGLLFPFHVSGMSYSLSVISEWKPPEFRSFPPIELWLACVLFSAFHFGLRLPAIRTTMFLGLVHLALTSARNAELLGLIAPLLLMPSAGPQLRAAIRPEVKLSVPAGLVRGAIAACTALLVASACFVGAGVRYEQGPVLPRDALRAAVAAGASGPVFNSYNFGGYLIFSGIAPFIDGRADIYGDDFVRQYVKAQSGNVDVLKSLIRDYDIRWALVEPSSQVSAAIHALPGWRKVYEDAMAVAYLRDN